MAVAAAANIPVVGGGDAGKEVVGSVTGDDFLSAGMGDGRKGIDVKGGEGEGAEVMESPLSAKALSAARRPAAAGPPAIGGAACEVVSQEKLLLCSVMRPARIECFKTCGKRSASAMARTSTKGFPSRNNAPN